MCRTCYELWADGHIETICEKEVYLEEGRYFHSAESWYLYDDVAERQIYIDITSQYDWYVGLHDANGIPAVTGFRRSRRVKYECHHEYGLWNCEKGPAVKHYDKNGRLKYWAWYGNGELHNPYGAATSDGEYYISGQKMKQHTKIMKIINILPQPIAEEVAEQFYSEAFSQFVSWPENPNDPFRCFGG